MKLNAGQLRDAKEEEIEEYLRKVKRRPIYFILENIYDTYNVGGLFRLADALLVSKIYLCGMTETPPNPRIKKASIGTYKIVPWEYKKTAGEAIEEVKRETSNVKRLTKASRFTLHASPLVVAVEQDKKSVPYTEIDYQMPLALLLGNETYGTLPETLKLVDKVAEIPMWGINKSLNVIVSAAIVSYWAVSQA